MPTSSPADDTGHVRTGPDDAAVSAVLHWYHGSARDLPWRASDRTAWGVLVSEVMLQQTQVARVEPRWRSWMARWPTPAALADAPVAEVLAHWQGLGYPRRALRLHQAARAITHQHGGAVPAAVAQLRALPGIGEYTASAVAAFAFGEPVAVLDTNVRRVHARWLDGSGLPSAAITNRERARASALLPRDGTAPLWSVAVMELGALVCTARSPACGDCPLRARCAWVRSGRPAAAPRTGQPRFEGSDRQARGHLLRSVIGSGSSTVGELIAGWTARRAGDSGAAAQAERALQSLLRDGLLEAGGPLSDADARIVAPRS